MSQHIQYLLSLSIFLFLSSHIIYYIYHLYLSLIFCKFLSLPTCRHPLAIGVFTNFFPNTKYESQNRRAEPKYSQSSSVSSDSTDCSKSASIITPSMTCTTISFFLTSTISDRILLTTSIPSMSFEMYKGNPDNES